MTTPFLVFCTLQGCDASILLDSDSAKGITSETASSANFGIRRLDIIDGVKLVLEEACPNTVSCADIIAIAGREAVAFSGGPRIIIPFGRRDSTLASTAEADARLPGVSIGVDQFISLFAAYGMTIAESVAIMGECNCLWSSSSHDISGYLSASLRRGSAILLELELLTQCWIAAEPIAMIFLK
jgi:hypothetical protein